MRIETLYLKNFRNVVEQTYTFNPHFTVLIGINGTGKSTWLHALRVACGTYFLDIPPQEVNRRHIVPDEIRLTSNGFLMQHVPVVVEAKGYFAERTQPIIWRRQVQEGKKNTTYSAADVGEIKSIGKQKYDTMKTGSDDLDLPIIAFFGTSRVHGTGRNRETRIGRQIFKEGYHSWLEMRSTVYRYDSWLTTYDILVTEGKEYPHSKQVFFDTLLAANPYIKKIAFVGTELWLKVQMKNEPAEYLPMHLHSDGIIAFTEMVAELAYRCIVLNGNKQEKAIIDTKGVVLIDELDLHLHPNWQRHVVSDLKKAFPNIQFVATTHSPFIVQSLAKDELINLDENEDGLDSSPSNYGIEDVAEIEMGVKNVARSEAFKERVEVAGQYYQLISEGKSSKTDEEVARLRQQLNEMEERFSDDATFVAILRLERKAHKI